MKLRRLSKITGCLFVCLSVTLAGFSAGASSTYADSMSADISSDSAATDSDSTTVSSDTVNNDAHTVSDAASSAGTSLSGTDGSGSSSSKTEEPGTAESVITESGNSDSSSETEPSLNAASATDLRSVSYASLTAGYYEISPKQDVNKAVETAGASKNDSANVQIGSYTGDNSQLWYVNPLGSGSYSFKNANSGKMLDISGCSSVSGSNVQQYSDNGTAAQKWTVTVNADGYCTLTASYCANVLDLWGGQTTDGNNVWSYSSNNTNAQRWKLTRRTAAIQDGLYTIRSACTSERVLDVAGGSTADGANIQIYQSNGTVAQKFVVKSAGNGYCYILCLNTHKALDVTGNSSNDGANVQQYSWNKTSAQKWKIEDDGTGNCSVMAACGKYLDVDSARDQNSTNVQIYTGNGTAAQKWVFTKISAETPTEGTSYKIASSLNSGMVLDVAGGTWQDSTNVQVWSDVCNSDSTNQEFKFTDEGNGYFSFINSATGKALDVAGAKASNGTNVQVYAYNGSAAQKWKLVPTEDNDGGFYIVSALGLYLDLKNGGSTSGTNVQIYTGNSSAAQKFYLVKTAFNGNGWYTTRSQERSYYTSGTRATGWKKIGIPYYYFNKDGVLLTNTKAGGFYVDAQGRKGLVAYISDNVKPGGRTVKNLLQNAMKACGRTLYIWGGGWEDDSQKIGYLPSWGDFFLSHATSTYDRQQYRYSYWSGVDCSGYVAWVIYNAVFTKDNQFNFLYADGTYYSSTMFAERLANLGWATKTGSPSDMSAYRPGDVGCLNGHVVIMIGTCQDGSAVFIHASPVGGTYGGGVQITGTVDRNGNSNSEGYRLAKTYMDRYFFEWPYGTALVSRSYVLQDVLYKATWITSGNGVLTDPDGYQSMTAAQVLKNIFGEA